MAQGFVAFLGIEKLFAELKEGAKEFVQEERALNGLTMMLEQFGGKSSEIRPKVEAFKEALEKEGVEGSVTLGIIRELSPVTKDLDNTLRAAKLASDIAATGMMSYGDAAGIVRDLVADTPRGLMRAHKVLGVQATTTQGALDELYGRFKGYTENIQDHQKTLDKFTTAWHEFWKKAAGDVIGWFDTAMPYWNAWDKATDDWANKYVWHTKQISGSDKEQITTLQHRITAWTQERATMEQGSEQWHTYTKMISQAKQELSELGVLLNKTGKVVSETPETPTGAPKTNPREKPDKGGAGDAEKAQAKAMEDLAKSVNDLRKAETDEAKAALASAEGKKAILAAASHVVAALDAEKKAEQAVIQVDAKNKVDAAKGNATAIAAIKAEEANKLLALDMKFAGEEEKVWKDAAKNRKPSRRR